MECSASDQVVCLTFRSLVLNGNLELEHSMHPIVYDVAVSLDGFICGPDGDVSQFAHDGEVVEDYNRRLSTYATAIMGRSTYEFGYKFGLVAGQNPYPHLETIVFSTKMEVPKESKVVFQRDISDGQISDIAAASDGPIYLCGGGDFAGSLLMRGMIDRIVLKRAPIVLGGGVSLFGQRQNKAQIRRVSTKTYDNGYVLEEFTL